VLRQAAEVAAHASSLKSRWETLAQLAEALDAGARMVLLDNMDLPTLHEAVASTAAGRFWKYRAATPTGLREY
jgi:nicotinate-nucleotide pyrophosphorylase (carboxylating)